MSKHTGGLALVTVIATSILLSGMLVQGQEGRGRGRAGGQPQVVGPEAPAIGFFGSYRVAAEKMDPSKLPIIGAWRLNFDKSDPSMRAQGRFKDTGTTIYTAVDGGIRTETFLFYPPTRNDYKTKFGDDAREYWFKLDGKNIYKMDPSKLPIIGAWRLNFDKSDPSMRAQGRFKDTGTTIYTAVDGGIRTETFLFYPPTRNDYKTKFGDDAREYWFKLDGKNIY